MERQDRTYKGCYPFNISLLVVQCVFPYNNEPSTINSLYIQKKSLRVMFAIVFPLCHKHTNFFLILLGTKNNCTFAAPTEIRKIFLIEKLF